MIFRALALKRQLRAKAHPKIKQSLLDPVPLEFVHKLIQEKGIKQDTIEFEMLKGVTPERLQAIQNYGYRTRIYLPCSGTAPLVHGDLVLLLYRLDCLAIKMQKPSSQNTFTLDTMPSGWFSVELISSSCLRENAPRSGYASLKSFRELDQLKVLQKEWGGVG